VRLAADFDNFRKRVREDEHQMRRREQARVIATWLDPLDATERALDTAPDKTSAWFEGLASIHRQMIHALTTLGVERIATDGMFDPQLHEALSILPGSGAPEGT